MTGWLIEALVASAVLMALVLVIRAPVRRTFGPGIAYALWALPVVRLLLPPLSMPSWLAWRHAAPPQIAQRASETLTIYVIEPISGSAAAPDSLLPSLGAAAAVLWGVGAAAFVLWHALAHVRFCRRMIDNRVGSSHENGVEVIETTAASGPLAFGIFRRYVAFPPDFAERYDDDERELALAHELGHHARGDLFANWIALFVLALHWFNPLAWRAFRAFRADQEMANDARVLAGRSAIDRHAYACAIVKAAHGGAVSAACHLHTVQDLKGRLKMLTTGRRSRLRLTVGAATVGMLTLGGLAATASGTAAAASVRARVETVTGLDLSTGDAGNRQSRTVASPAEPVAAAEISEPEDAADPAAPQDVADTMPPVPAAPPAPAAPAAPAAPPADAYAGVPGAVVVTTGKDGKKVMKHVRYVRVKDGKTLTDDYRYTVDVPDVRSANCSVGGNDQRLVINGTANGRKFMVICNDRIQKIQVDAQSQANAAVLVTVNSRQIERQAKLSALAGLRASRASVAGSLDGIGRAEALNGIDQAIRELESQIDSKD